MGTKNEERKTYRDTGTRAMTRGTGPEMAPDEFRALGHQLVDHIAAHMARMPEGPVKPDETSADVRAVLDAERGLPEIGADAGELLESAANLLFDHSLFNGHPR